MAGRKIDTVASSKTLEATISWRYAMGGDGQSDKPLVRFDVEDSVGVITIDNPPVNALAPGVRDGIVEAMVLIGAGRSFMAGADIRAFGKPRATPRRLTHDALDACTKPVVAA